MFKTETGKGNPIDVSAIFLFNLFGLFICICFTCIDIVFHRNIQFTGFFAVGIARKYVNFSVADGGYPKKRHSLVTRTDGFYKNVVDGNGNYIY